MEKGCDWQNEILMLLLGDSAFDFETDSILLMLMQQLTIVIGDNHGIQENNLKSVLFSSVMTSNWYFLQIDVVLRELRIRCPIQSIIVSVGFYLLKWKNAYDESLIMDMTLLMLTNVVISFKYR